LFHSFPTSPPDWGKKLHLLESRICCAGRFKTGPPKIRTEARVSLPFPQRRRERYRTAWSDPISPPFRKTPFVRNRTQSRQLVPRVSIPFLPELWKRINSDPPPPPGVGALFYVPPLAQTNKRRGGSVTVVVDFPSFHGPLKRDSPIPSLKCSLKSQRSPCLRPPVISTLPPRPPFSSYLAAARSSVKRTIDVRGPAAPIFFSYAASQPLNPALFAPPFPLAADHPLRLNSEKACSFRLYWFFPQFCPVKMTGLRNLEAFHPPSSRGRDDGV